MRWTACRTTPVVALRLAGLSAFVVTIALYVSTTCRTGLRAIVVSLPAVFVSYLLVNAIPFSLLRVLTPIRRVTPATSLIVAWLSFAIFVAIILAVAGRNHRSIDRRPSQIAVQVGGLIATVAVMDSC